MSITEPMSTDNLRFCDTEQLRLRNMLLDNLIALTGWPSLVVLDLRSCATKMEAQIGREGKSHTYKLPNISSLISGASVDVDLSLSILALLLSACWTIDSVASPS